MSRYEVTYQVFNADGTRSGPSHYVTVVEAQYQSAAEQMVKNMNGGSRCYIQRCMLVG